MENDIITIDANGLLRDEDTLLSIESCSIFPSGRALIDEACVLPSKVLIPLQGCPNRIEVKAVLKTRLGRTLELRFCGPLEEKAQ